MPNVIEVSSARAVFYNPFGYTSMMVRDKNANFDAKPLQKAKAPFYSFKLCLVAATSLICLQDFLGERDLIKLIFNHWRAQDILLLSHLL